MKTYDLIIIIPCYNEYRRLKLVSYITFLKKYDAVKIIFVDDASRDHTVERLNELHILLGDKISIISLTKNVGKAEAVRRGVVYAYEKDYRFGKIGYLDADGATPLEECVRISRLIKEEVKFAFGSRINKIDNVIKRKLHRHFVGRVIATFISSQLKLPVYDTQCGCKIFSKDLAKQIFGNSFISKWLFDVEIFHRIIKIFGHEEISCIVNEEPVREWIDRGRSKVSIFYFFRLWIDLILIHRKYNVKGF